MNATIRQLESEAEAARAKLAADLAVLRAPSTYSEFKDGLKQEAMDAKDAVVESVRSNVKSTAEGLIDDLKAKAAANPGAALLIGAGVAWRLLKDPPIATALVGAGLFSLLRTAPQPGHRQMSDEAYLEQAKLRLKEQASDLALNAKERAAGLGDGIKQQAADWQDFAKAKTQEWRDATVAATNELRTEVSGKIADAALSAAGTVDEATEAAKRSRDRIARKVASATEYGKTTAANGYAAVQRTAQSAVSEQNRDKLLLGAAGIAVTAALTLALQRRINGSA